MQHRHADFSALGEIFHASANCNENNGSSGRGTTIKGSRYHSYPEATMHMLGQISGRLIEWYRILTVYLTVHGHSQYKKKIEIKYLQYQETIEWE